MKKHVRTNLILILCTVFVGAGIATVIATPIFCYFTKYDWLQTGIIFFIANMISMYPVLWFIRKGKQQIDRKRRKRLFDKRISAIIYDISDFRGINPNFELREWRLPDAKSLAENANNIHLWNSLRDAFPHPFSETDGKAYVKRALSHPKPATSFAIVVDGKAVGSISISLRTDVEQISAELGYYIGENYWNRGIMTDAVKQIVTYTFANFPHLRKIYATSFDSNIASRKVLEKAGFEREAILKQGAVKNGTVVDLYYYSRFK